MIVFGSGLNESNQLGDKSDGRKPHILSFPGDSISNVAIGDFCTLIIYNNGDVYAAGDNTDGKIWNLDQTVLELPTKLPIHSKIRNAAVSSTNCMYLTYEGKLIMSKFENQTIDISRPDIYITAFDDFFLACDNSGFFYLIRDENYVHIEQLHFHFKQPIIGFARSKQMYHVLLNDGKVFSKEGPLNSDAKFAYEESLIQQNIVKISGTTNHCLALSSEGIIFACGSNEFGQFGSGNNDSSLDCFIRIEELSSHQIVQIAAGKETSQFLTNAGELLTCGWNKFGQLFLYNTEDANIAQIAKFGCKISQIVPSAFHSIIVSGESNFAKQQELICYQPVTVEQLEEENDKLQAKINSLLVEIQEKSETNSRKEEIIFTMKEKLENVQKEREENDKSQKHQIKSLSKSCLKYKNSLKQVQIQNQELNNLNNKIKQEIGQLEQQCNHLSEVNDALKNENDEKKLLINNYQAAIKSNEKKLKKLETEKADYKAQIKALQKQVNELNEKLDNKEQELNNLTNNLKETLGENKNLKGQIDKQTKDIDKKDKQMEKVKKEYLKLKKVNKGLEQELDDKMQEFLRQSDILDNITRKSGKLSFPDFVINPNDYDVLEKLGRGRFGDVYKIRNIKTGKLYAKKVFETITEENQKKFARECEIGCAINHPCILKYFGFFLSTQEQPPSIYLDYVSNGTLQTILSSNPSEWTSTRKSICILEIVCGMVYLHSRGIIHRDLKPSNILCDHRYNFKISDFSESTFNDADITMTGGVGSLIFMSPEVFDGDSYNEKVDVYSFGMILYNIVTGSLPANKKSDLLKGQIPSFPPNIISFVTELIKSCLNHDPSARPSFSDILKILARNDFKVFDDVDSLFVFDKYDQLMDIK